MTRQSTPKSSAVRIKSLACGVAFVVACGGAAKQKLVAVGEIAASDACPIGGTRLQSGLDKNSNGLLDIAEVESSKDICLPAPVAITTSVSATQTVSPGGECRTGGVRVDIGLDNGDGSGVAKDGVLQDGEIDSSQLICNAVLAPAVGDLTSPPGPTGSASIVTRGGNSNDSGNVGFGGDVTIVALAPSYGGHVKLFKTGSIPLSPRALPTPNTDSAACSMQSGDLTLTVSASPPVGAPDGCWLNSNLNNRLMKGTGVATGLVVEATARLFLNSSFIVNGNVILRGGLTATGAGAFTFAARQVRILSGGSFVAERAMTWQVDELANEGIISTSAVAGTTGSALNLNARVFDHRGSITAQGRNGGVGGDVTIQASVIFFSSGSINVSGGNGQPAAQSGGAGGLVEIEANGIFEFQLGGSITTDGGLATGNQGGGPAGNITIRSNVIRRSTVVANFFARGGAAPSTGTGGAGGDVRFTGAGQGVRLGASIDTQGGVGLTGGKGGVVRIEYSPTAGAEIEWQGLATIDARHGLEGRGSEGGEIVIGHRAELQELGGSVLNEADLLTSGDSNDAVRLSTAVLGADAGVEQVINRGNINVSGLNTTSGGKAVLVGKSGVNNSGSIEANGGGECCFSVDGGRDAGKVQIAGLNGPATNSGVIVANGSTSISGGLGGQIDISGTQATNTGSLTANGGGATLGNAVGARGGSITISSVGGASINSGTILVAGGSAPLSAGAPGVVLIDGVVQ